MRRLDVVLIGVGLFAAGGILYWLFQWVGLDHLDAGIWTQLVLVIGIIGWLLTYLYRALTHTMTYNQQLKEYEDAVLQKRLDAMTPEELAALQAEVEAEKRSHSTPIDSTQTTEPTEATSPD
jgi:membrane protein implicated in regulation of membrane protease activity